MGAVPSMQITLLLLLLERAKSELSALLTFDRAVHAIVCFACVRGVAL
jgi:hypothetical protein